MAGKAQGMKIWRKMITLIALAFALVIFADGFKTVSRAETGTTNNAVNMRKTPSKNGDLVQKLEKGTSVELGDLVDGKDGDGKKWYAVTANGKSGYIRSDLISKGSSTSTSTNEGTVSGEVESVTPVGASVAGSNTVRVRTSASTTSSNNILATVAKGTEVTVIGKIVGSDKKTWYQVKLTVEGKDVVGYIRSDYLVISGEVKPVETTTTTPDPVENTDPVDNTETKPVEVTPAVQKRYETKLINDEWWIQDHDKNEQYKIEQLFSAANEYKNRYEEANKKAKSRKGWMIFFLILALAACGAAGYLLFRLKETKEAAFIASIENNTPRRTSDRPREARGQQGGGRPAIKDGLEPRSRDERPANGQRSSGNRPQQGQRPAQQQGQRPEGQPSRPAQPAQGQRPANGQQQGQRPAQQPGQGQRPAGGQQPGQGQRPAQQPQPRPEGQPSRPAQPAQGQRPAENQQRPMQQPTPRPEGQPQRPAQPAQGQRPAENQQRPAQPQQTAARPKNFVQDSDDMEFEFLNWDSDE